NRETSGLGATGHSGRAMSGPVATGRSGRATGALVATGRPDPAMTVAPIGRAETVPRDQRKVAQAIGHSVLVPTGRRQIGRSVHARSAETGRRVRHPARAANRARHGVRRPAAMLAEANPAAGDAEAGSRGEVAAAIEAAGDAGPGDCTHCAL
ncbi:MAG: hypothetical protein ABIP65_00590, partial [Vicinamibacterales bacterium]